jgi:preprotein translocase subunit SecD
MRHFKIVLLILISLLIIWIDLPENLRVNFKVLNQKIDFIINPLKIDTQIFGLKIKKEFKTHLGLDLKGGSHLVFEADTTKSKKKI